MNKTRYIPTGYTLHQKNGDLYEVYRNGLTAIAYVGKQSKPTWHYSFRGIEALEKKVMDLHSSTEAWEKRKAERKEARKNNTAMAGVGSIFRTCWGYNMTNVEFLQVVKETERTVWFEEIDQVETSTGFLSGTTVPVPNSFRNSYRTGEREVFQARKRVGDKGGVYFTFTERPGGYGRSASKWDGTPCYFNHCD